MQEIQSIQDIQTLVQSGFQDWQNYGDVRVKQHQDLLIFNYLDIAENKNR